MCQEKKLEMLGAQPDWSVHGEIVMAYFNFTLTRLKSTGFCVKHSEKVLECYFYTTRYLNFIKYIH